MIADTILMIRPTAFGFNSETATSNSFQKNLSVSGLQIKRKALQEFEGLLKKIQQCGIEVVLHNDTVTPIKPDAVFPNNWFSTHPDGTVILYPMLAPIRRTERRSDIIDRLRNDFYVSQIIDLSKFENENCFLEGTGSMVFDHASKVIYANVSPRTNPKILWLVADALKYNLETFKATNIDGSDIYHTNVLMNVSDLLAVVCAESITESKQNVLARLKESGKEIVLINRPQLEQFAGNMLMLKNRSGKKFMVMSDRAFGSLEKAQIDTIGRHADILHVPIETIEDIGGGSARCMMAEIFLPPR